MFSEGRSHFSFIAVGDNLSAGNMNLGLILTNGIEEKPVLSSQKTRLANSVFG